MKTKQIIALVVLIPLFIGGLIAFWMHFTNNTNDCGNIFAKIPSYTVGKYETSNKFILVIDFKKMGRREIVVSASDFVSHKEGDAICFEVSNPESFLQRCAFVWGILCLALLGIIGLWYLVELIAWITA